VKEEAQFRVRLVEGRRVATRQSVRRSHHRRKIPPGTEWVVGEEVRRSQIVRHGAGVVHSLGRLRLRSIGRRDAGWEGSE
jgi:hypothetical protein